ncbi:MAG: N-acetylmuramoyl-L-alanine amidase-like domain-containing protein [Candidatus Sericytochromatia bacterium]
MRLFRLTATLALCLVAAPAFADDAYGPSPLTEDDLALRSLTAALPAETAMPKLVAQVAERFVGRPYGEHLLDASDSEELVARLDAFDCVTLVESSLAIARTVAGRAPTGEAFRTELERLRYRGGTRDGYASRLHYFSEWISDNERRGLVKDITLALGGQRDARAINFMTHHRKAYRKLGDDATFAQIQAAEAALTRRPRFVLPKAKLASVLPMLQSGDIVAIATDIEGLDVVHTGLVYRKPDGTVHLLHAPEPGTTVTVSSKPLVEYLQQFKVHVGVMIARPLKP